MNGLAINFTDAGPLLDFTRAIAGEDAEMQNVMVNIGTQKGTDPLFADRGTELLLAGVRGRLVSPTWARHDANFAALDTLAFVKANDQADNEFGISILRLGVKDFLPGKLVLSVYAEFENGSVRGKDYTV